MQFTNFLLAGLAMVAVVFAQSNAPMINTPNPLIQCQPYQITYSGGTPPYNIYATREGQFGSILAQIKTGATGTSYTWTVNLKAGTAINLFITDSSGQSNTSGAATVQQSSDTSCLGTANTSSASSGASATQGGSSASSTQAGSTSGATGASTSNNASSRSSSGSSPAQTSGPSNGASQLTGFSAAVAGAVGVVVAALV